jgi:hypothetical protein
MAISKKTETAKAPIPDDAEKLAPATEFAASGAFIEPEIVSRVDMKHPAIDNAPRERSTPDMNRLDPNTPSALTTQEEEVEKELKAGS